MRGKRIRVALVGVGNCASSLVQGVHYYREAKEQDEVPGLMHVRLGDYHIRDIEFSAAFDVNATKVGKDLAEAIDAEPNNTLRFADVPETGAIVQRGPTLDGLGKYLRQVIEESDAEPVDVAAALRASRTQVVVCYMPVGSEQAVRFYAEEALKAGCAFINCVPVFIASDPAWSKRFTKAGLPVIGDDIKSQVGATITHRVLTNLFVERGVRLDRTYQLNFGGNTDFMNMLERERLESKKISKTGAVTSQLGHPMPSDQIHISPSDYIPWLDDRKWCHIHMEGTTFGGAPIKCEVKLEVWDSPNSAGVVIDAIRCARLGLDRGEGGALTGPASYFMKTPPRQFTDSDARLLTEAFISGEEPPKVKPARGAGRPQAAVIKASGHAPLANGKANGHANGHAAAANGKVNGKANGRAEAANGKAVSHSSQTQTPLASRRGGTKVKA